MSGPEEPDMERRDSPNGTNNDTDWLDELGKEPTSIYDESDSAGDKDPDQPGKDQLGDEMPEWLEDDLEQDVPVDEAVPDWLKEEMAAEEGKSPGKAEAGQELDIEDTAVFSQPLNLADEDIPEWLSDEVEDEQASQPGTEEADELSWLDQIAAGEGAAIDEPPTLSWDDQEQEAGEELDDSAEEDMTWLDDMSTLPAVTAEELAARSGESWPTSPAEEEQPGQEESLDDEDTPEAVPEDPDEAMAWLERLAARQGAPAEELPSITEEHPELSVVDAGEMPEDPDEAMAWLDKMAGEEPDEEIVEAYQEVQEGPEIEGAFEVDEVVEEAVVEADMTTPADEEFDVALSGLEGVEMPGDMDEALSWLEDMIVEEEPESQPIEEEPTLVEEEHFEADEAMAWLEQLAAKQGAPLEELTTIDSEIEEPEAPEWSRQEMDEALEEAVDVEPEVAEELDAEEVEVESAMDVHEFEIPTLEEEPLKLDSEIAGIFEEEGVLEEPDSDEPVFEFEDMPEVEDWSESAGDTGALDPAVVDEATQEDLAWMDTLGEVDPESWLEAEAEATSPELIIPEITTDAGQTDEVEAPEREALELGEEAVEAPAVDPVDLLGEVDGVLDAERLQAARGAIAAGNLDTALNEFDTLLQKGEGLPYLIAELQSSISDYGEQPRLQRLLGDAYVQNGQLKKAIEVYRQALDNL